MKGYVYCLIFPNKKRYVGMVWSKWPSYRFREHCRKDNDVGKAIRKFGPDNVELVILKKHTSYETLLELEKFYIKKYSTFGKGGYNKTLGGLGTPGHKSTKHQKEAVSKTLEILRADPIIKEKMRQASIRNMTRIHADPALKEKMSIARAEKWKDPEYKAKMRKVLQQRNADPEFSAESSERLRKLNADPEFQKRAWLGRMKKQRERQGLV